jgi:hypothetical protein
MSGCDNLSSNEGFDVESTALLGRSFWHAACFMKMGGNGATLPRSLMMFLLMKNPE